MQKPRLRGDRRKKKKDLGQNILMSAVVSNRLSVGGWVGGRSPMFQVHHPLPSIILPPGYPCPCSTHAHSYAYAHAYAHAQANTYARTEVACLPTNHFSFLLRGYCDCNLL